MPRFVVLQHDCPRGLHWDFMIQDGPALATWAMPLPPTPNHEFPAQHLPDHRTEFLDYQGTLSNNRGYVVRWDEGTYQFIKRTDDCLVMQLSGEKLLGRVEITRLSHQPEQWRFRMTDH